jgi:uncharacterized protein involved in exopolysaccharide biosynthesis
MDNQPHHSVDDEIDLFELFATIWDGKWSIIGITSIVAAISIVVSLQLPNIFRVESSIAPVESNSSGGLSGLMSQYGGLASLAGIQLPSVGGGGQTEILLEVMQSRSFIADFINKYQFAPRLIAVIDYNPITQEETLDPEIYDVQRDEWLRVVDPPKAPKPSDQELYQVFIDALTVEQDKTAPTITVAFEHRSPKLAEEIVRRLVDDIDQYARTKDRTDSQNALAYLEQKLTETRLVELERALYQMIESQTKTLMLAEVNKDYAFTVIDPPVIPEIKSKPKRSLIVILATLVGGMIGVLFVLIRSAIRNRRHL